MAYNETPTNKGNAMFKNRALQVTLVKTNNTDTTNVEVDSPFVTPEELNKLLAENIKRVTFHIVGAVAAGYLMHAASEIVINKLTK